MTETLHSFFELAAAGIEALAVAIMLVCIVFGTVQWRLRLGKDFDGAYHRYRQMLGKSLQIGLELLVAADIIRTVILELTLNNVLTLGALVLVRTFLGWSLSVEVEGHWPWQGSAKAEDLKPDAQRELQP